MNLSEAQAILDDGLRDRAFPGGVLVIGNSETVLTEQVFGSFDYSENSTPVRENTIYDVASLTKIVATTTLAMMLYEEGRLPLDAPVGIALPGVQDPVKRAITIRQLLTHSSGFPGFRDLTAHEPLAEQILSTPLSYTPGTQSLYSDLGMILLGHIVEGITGKSLDQLAERRIFQPLGMADTQFRPAPAVHPRVAPTRPDSVGVVHDSNARNVGGVAGHAGLFSTGRDLSRFCQMMLNGGATLLKPETIRLFTRIDTAVPNSTRALGWDTPSADGSSAGQFLAAGSFGHTGFTGTSIWIDPNRGLYVIFLTNRVYGDDNNLKIREIRPRLHDAIVRAFDRAASNRD